MTYPPLKRVLDVAGALLLMGLLWPLILLVAVAALVAQGRPIFFIQIRPGLHEKSFRIIKFRTLASPTSGGTGENSRMTSFGRLLRLLSIDESPQLLNILRGDMSFVGPRPLLVEYLPLYSRTQRKRHDVRPGLTGLAQVEGRNDVPWERKLELDVMYSARMSFGLDSEIIFRSLALVVLGKGVAPHNEGASSKFKG